MSPKKFATPSLSRPTESHQAAERAHYLPAQRLMTPARSSSLPSPLSHALAHQVGGKADGCCRRAVLIGIQYKGHKYGEQNFELPASHSGVKDIKDLLILSSYKNEDIDILMDDGDHTSPTHTNILAALSNLAEKTKPGDWAFVFYSGHGAQITNDDKTESDGFDELILPVDWDVRPGTKPHDRDHFVRYILDDKLNEILVKGMRVGSQLMALFDCCHAGTILDLEYCRHPNGKFTVEPIREEHQNMSLQVAAGFRDNGQYPRARTLSSRAPPRSSSGPLNLTPVASHWPQAPREPKNERPRRAEIAKITCLSSSHDGQKSWQSKKTGGIMTRAFVDSLKNRPEQSLRELLEDLATRIKNECHEIEEDDRELGSVQQVPQLSTSILPYMDAIVTL